MQTASQFHRLQISPESDKFSLEVKDISPQDFQDDSHPMWGASGARKLNA